MSVDAHSRDIALEPVRVQAPERVDDGESVRTQRVSIEDKNTEIPVDVNQVQDSRPAVFNRTDTTLAGTISDLIDDNRYNNVSSRAEPQLVLRTEEVLIPRLGYEYPPNYNEANNMEIDCRSNMSIEPAAVAPGSLPESRNLRRARMFASFITLFLAGWNGGSIGALLPYIEKAYGIDYARVSILFICTFLGYLVAAGGTGALARRLGFGKAITVAVIVELAGNVINSSQQVHFGLMCFGFFVVGIAFATQLGLCNAYFAVLPKPLLWTGLLHGIYGLGAFASPLVATQMVIRGIPYHFFYITNIAMNVPVLVCVWLAFRKLDVVPTPAGEPQHASGVRDTSIKDTLKSRAVWTLSIFLMCYVGAEETIGGWIVTYVMDVRHGTPQAASWVASSFYLGIALGRLFLPTLNLLLGERPSVFLYILIAIALEMVAWFVPHVAATATSTALVGLAISTFYTAAITMGGKLLPRPMHADAFALISSIGQSGSAFFPLLVGLISTRKGIWVVEPTVVALMGGQAVLWFLVPKVERRDD